MALLTAAVLLTGLTTPSSALAADRVTDDGHVSQAAYTSVAASISDREDSDESTEIGVWRPRRRGRASAIRRTSTSGKRQAVTPAVRLQASPSTQRTSSADLDPIDPFDDPVGKLHPLKTTGREKRLHGAVANHHDFNDENPFPFEPADYEEESADYEDGFTDYQDQITDEGPEIPDLGSEGDPADDELAQGPGYIANDCRAPQDLKRIYEITNDIAATPGEFPPECTLGNEPYEPRNWAMTTYAWKASALCHKPLYFEQAALERYGHTWGPVAEPFVSGAHFFGSVLVLPYNMGLELPCECVYDLGYYRPGSCAPRMIYPVPLSLRGALFEAGAWVGGVYLIP